MHEMTHFMHSHKNMEDGVKKLMEVMMRAGCITKLK
jgi:hypothetical protein